MHRTAAWHWSRFTRKTHPLGLSPLYPCHRGWLASTPRGSSSSGFALPLSKRRRLVRTFACLAHRSGRYTDLSHRCRHGRFCTRDVQRFHRNAGEEGSEAAPPAMALIRCPWLRASWRRVHRSPDLQAKMVRGRFRFRRGIKARRQQPARLHGSLAQSGMSDAQIKAMAENRQLPESVDVVSPVEGLSSAATSVPDSISTAPWSSIA